jgi:polysaccharide export outer membrane protein
MSRWLTPCSAALWLALCVRPSPAAEPQYEIGPGDVLQVLVLGQPTLSGEFSVGSDGIMPYPFVGKVKAAGMSPAELERKLTTLLGDGYLRRPQVSVSVRQYKSQRVFVTGEVPRPGPYGLRPNRKLSSLLQDLGDLGTSVGHEVVVIRPPDPAPPVPTTGEDGWVRTPPPAPSPSPRDGPMLPGEGEGAQVYHVNLRELRSGYPDRDLELQVGDTVYFPKAAHVYVTGFVARPGILVYEEGLTVYQAMNLAGGVTERGSEKGVRIVRLVEGKRKTIRPKLSDVVQPEDTVQVPERFF